jgi:NAD+ synthase
MVNIKECADAMLSALKRAGVQYTDDFQEDFVLGNIKARQRMIAQYAIAGARAGVVIGTNHAAEPRLGYFTKFGDGAADILPLAGLTKRRVRESARVLGASVIAACLVTAPSRLSSRRGPARVCNVPGSSALRPGPPS